MQPHKHVHVPDECLIAFICCHFSRKHFFWRDWHPSAALPKVTEGILCCASAALPHRTAAPSLSAHLVYVCLLETKSNKYETKRETM